MTDPTAPVTPRTEAGRRLAARAKREAWGNWEGIAQFEIPAIEREAGIDVERLGEFFHEEYWAEANEPHWPREQADATDCEVCWSSAAKLHARLSRESDR
jgi:hypothetical protein